VGAVDEKTIREYIENQKWDDEAEGFKITAPTDALSRLWVGALQRLQPQPDFSRQRNLPAFSR
jgi:hypothetical protein